MVQKAELIQFANIPSQVVVSHVVSQLASDSCNRIDSILIRRYLLHLLFAVFFFAGPSLSSPQLIFQRKVNHYQSRLLM